LGRDHPEGDVIGAGSVVTPDVPEGVFAAGNPFRVFREIAGSVEGHA
jgi:acetyltransferase-like isoleucine patch superfamily enzyme